jgi:hypothetical protein
MSVMTDVEFKVVQDANPGLQLGRCDTELGTFVFRKLRRPEWKRVQNMIGAGEIGEATEYAVQSAAISPDTNAIMAWLDSDPAISAPLSAAVLKHSGSKAAGDVKK